MDTQQKKDNDNVKVAVRSRLLNSREKKIKSKVVADVDAANNQMILKKPSDMKATKSFRFVYVYGVNSTQKEIYEDTAYPLVESVYVHHVVSSSLQRATNLIKH